MNYEEQLKDVRWLKKRVEILIRDNAKCRKCGYVSLRPHIHHLRYISGRMAWEYNNDDLVTLCPECHKREHRRDIKTAGYYIRKWKRNVQIIEK